MADTEDRESKTEEPSEKKIADSLDKGNVPFSREVPVLASLACIYVAAYAFLGGGVSRFTLALAQVIGEAGTWHLDGGPDAGRAASQLAAETARFILPLLATLAAGGIVAPILQNPFQIAVERIKPQLSRISPSQGWRRIFGLKGLVEFLKSLVKLCAVAVITGYILRSELPDVQSMLNLDPALIPATTLSLTMRLIVSAAVVATALAVVDLVWSRFNWRHELRMTRQEIKDEHKQAEGDPFIKARIRQIARARASRRMMAAVPRATVVITNPTHYAVALRYTRRDGGAPVILAKGADLLAQKIRAIAAECDIPTVENKPLARALYEKADVGSMIPQEFYRVVAEIIHFLQMRKVRAIHIPAH